MGGLQEPHRGFSRLVFDVPPNPLASTSRTGDPSGMRWLPWGRWCASNHRDHRMSGEVETPQAEVDLKALEGFREGNQDLERLKALLDAHHLLRLRGRGVEACLRRGGDRDRSYDRRAAPRNPRWGRS